jgi:nucleoside-diphosphate-sugar epimerase
MSHYLITGAAGFIASRVIEMLAASGHTVYGVDNLNDAYDVRMKLYRLARLQQLPGFTFEKMDISDRAQVDALTRSAGQPDAVINLAARAGVRSSELDPWLYVDTNVTGTLNMLELARKLGTPKFVLASSSSVYNPDAPMPYREDADTDHPRQPYASTKKAAEQMAHVYHFLHGLDVSVVRYFTVYGPAGRPESIMFRCTQWIAEGRPVRLNGDGTQTRGFTYIDDIARGTILALQPLGFEVFNLGGHEVISLNELIALLEERLHKKAIIEHSPMHKADVMGNLADCTHAREKLGWAPAVPLQEGVANLVAWYRAEREWASQVRTD